jgi:UDP-N-acetylmuramoylalanine--D-glutamate ligase
MNPARGYFRFSHQRQNIWSKDLKESVETAKKITKKGGACVLSPAAASYTHFKNFEDRGEQFCSL